jgi:hypothetical protein
MWTERERVKAEAGEVVQDLDDLRSKVCELELMAANDPLMYTLSWREDTLMAAAKTLIPICAFQWMFLEGESISLT